MISSRLLKATLMAAASLGVAAAATAHAADPVKIERAPVEYVQAQTTEIDSAAVNAASPVAKKASLLAAAAAVGALLVRMIGLQAISNAVGKTGAGLKRAAQTAAKAPAAAVKAVAKSTSGPVRFAMLMGSLGLTAFLGIGFYDIEWIGGLVIGAALVGLSWYGARRTARVLSVRRARERPAPTETLQQG